MSSEAARELLALQPTTVLVVEDDEAVRRVVRRILTQLGYRVVEACDGWQAVEIWQAQPVDLVLCDVVMPMLSGPDAVRRLRAECGLRRALFMSGYSQEWLARTGAVRATDPFIAKPFSPAALAARIREALEA